MNEKEKTKRDYTLNVALFEGLPMSQKNYFLKGVIDGVVTVMFEDKDGEFVYIVMAGNAKERILELINNPENQSKLVTGIENMKLFLNWLESDLAK